jgi:hypothetical protein
LFLDALEKLREHPPSVFGADAHAFQLNPALTEAEVAAFEQKHRIRLPADFRDFLLTAGDGGAGPFYGVFPLGHIDNDFGIREWQEGDATVGSLCELFPFQEAWNDISQMPDESLADLDEADYEKRMVEFERFYWDRSLVNGAIPICHEGCAIRIWLVINGSQAGSLWEDRRSEYNGLRPVTLSDGNAATFNEWYGEWLAECLRAAES